VSATVVESVVLVNRAGIVTAVNEVLAARLGKGAADCVGQSVFSLMPAYAVAGLREVIDQVLLTGQAAALEDEQKGYWSRRSIIPLLDAAGAVDRFAIVEMEITERKRAEKVLHERNDYNRNLLEVSLDFLVTIGRSGRISDVNAATERATGLSRWELLGTDFSGHFTEPERAREGYQRVLRDGTVRDYPLEIRHRDGHATPVSFNAVVYRDKGGRVRGVLAAVRDITERKRAEEEKAELEAQNRQLQKSESLGRMAGAIAHHFNNQLQAVMMNLEMAMNELPPNAAPVEYLAEARQSARKAAEVSGLMLTYLGKSFGKREPLDLSEACRRSLPMLRAAMPEDVTLETDIPSPGPAISANANQIQQVLINLVTNAWEAGGDGRDAVRLTVKAVAAGDIPAEYRFPIDWQPQDKAYVGLEVADTGCGIAEADIEKLFDPFYSTKFTGRGLGLAVVLGIVRSHGGAVTVESTPGSGSAFRVYLPVSG
jgi:two-component system cell cycle sensor histidine kinase/response regulator CckA